MKRRYKLLLIILLGGILTIVINTTTVESKITLVSLGDGLSLGMTPYNVVGTSFNDYLKEKFESIHNLDAYNNEFSINHLDIHELNEYLEENTLGRYTRIPIKQTLAQADIITISIGIDSFADISLEENINNEIITKYLREMEKFLESIRDFYDKKIIVLGLYPAYKFDKKDAVEVNSKLSKLCGKYDTEFLDILAIALNENYYLEKNSYYINYQAHQKIADLIFSMYNK